MQNYEIRLNKIADDFENGDILAVDALLQAREIKAEIEGVADNLKQFEDHLMDYIEPTEHMGKKISIMNGRVTYDYKNVPEVMQLDAELKAKKKWYEVAFKQAVGIEKVGETYFFEEKPLPTVKYSKSFIKVENIKK